MKTHKIHSYSGAIAGAVCLLALSTQAFAGQSPKARYRPIINTEKAEMPSADAPKRVYRPVYGGRSGVIGAYSYKAKGRPTARSRAMASQ